MANEIEEAADDLLLLFSQIEAGYEPSNVAAVASFRSRGGIENLTRWLAEHENEDQETAAQAGYGAAAESLGGLTVAYLALAAAVLDWAATRTGLTPPEAVREVLAHIAEPED